jgi:hypothetical protein
MKWTCEAQPKASRTEESESARSAVVQAIAATEESESARSAVVQAIAAAEESESVRSAVVQPPFSGRGVE